MKAIVKTEAKAGLTWCDIPKPTPGPRDVLIKIKKTAICGTDVHIYKWDDWAQNTVPLGTTAGHEFVGIVEEVGSSVIHFKVGDRVSAEGHLTCGQCRHCLSGHREHCPKTRGFGYHCNGCFAEYFCVTEENVIKIPDDISDEIASILDPLGNCFFTTLSFDLVGKNVLIAGAGPIGLMAIAVAKRAGARKVIISDINEYRLSLAKKMKPDATIDVSKESMHDVMKKHNIDAFDVALEMSGSAKAFESLPQYLTMGGKLVLLGIVPKNAPIDWHLVIFKLLTIKGIWGRKIFSTWLQMFDLLQSGLDVTPVITHRFKASEFEKGFEAMVSGKSGKVILDWDGI